MNKTGQGNGLERKLGLVSVTSIVVANMIGAGIFTTSGLILGDLRNPLLMIGLWAGGGIIALCGALSYGELGAAIPRAGGEYTFLSSLYHPALGFLSGWVSLFAGFSAPIAASAIGFTEYLARAFPGMLSPAITGGGIDLRIMKKLIALLVILIFTAIHYRGLRPGARVQNILTGIKLIMIVGLVILGFSLGKGNAAHLFQGNAVPLTFSSLKTVGLSLMWIMFAYAGWNASAYIGSEIKSPTRNLPRSLILGTGIVTLLFLALNLLYVFAVPPERMAGVIPVGSLAAGNLFGRAFENVLSVLISFALFSSLSAYIILGPRVYYAMARDRHFFSFAAGVHKKYGVPAGSILLQSGLAMIMVLLGTFDQVLTYMGFSLGIFPILAVAGVFKLRRRGAIKYRMPIFPLAPLVFILASVVILILAFFERPVESSIAILMVLTGIPVFFLFFRKMSGHPEQPVPPGENG